VKNQLSPSLISLSPLITNHPKILQHLQVQSTTCSLLARLASGQLIGTAVIFTTLALAPTNYSPTHYTKGTIVLNYLIKALKFSFHTIKSL